MMMDQNEIDAEEISNERLEDLAAEEEEEEEEDDESDDDENSSNDDSGVENDESDDEDDEGSDEGESDDLVVEEDEEDDESDNHENSSNDDSGVEYHDEHSSIEYTDSEDDESKSEELKQFVLTFRKGNYDNEIKDALGRSDDSPLSNTNHPAGIDLYNKPDDWMERNAIGLENVKAQLQKHTSLVEDVGEFDLDLIHNSENIIDDEPVVWHDPSIDPYWEQLTAEFHDHIYISNIEIHNIEMRKETVYTLVRSLHGGAINSMRCVRFINTNLCKEGVVLLSTLVEQCSGLDQLDLSRNRIDDMNSALHLSRALKTHPNIGSLNMRHCDLGNDPEILSVILQSDVKHIYLSHNNIDSSGAMKISEYLTGDPPVEYLALNNNDLNDNDAFLLSQALKKNTDLRTFDLYQNNFTSVGVNALFACLFDGTSLNAISESNHTCELYFFDDDDEPIQDFFISLNEKFDRTSKILLALHDKESLLEYLADVPVKLMPDVLAFIQRERDQSLSMSMMYATMRWWNMPSLYSYHCCVSPYAKRKRHD